MTLDRETARALFGDAPAPTTVAPASAPYAASTASDFEHPSVFERIQGRKAARKGVDWRLAAPVAVAALCIGAVAIFALPRNNEAVEGKTVATADIAAPPVAPAAPLIATPAATTPAPVAEPAARPVVQRVAATPRPAARRATVSRTVAAAPSAVDSGSNASTTETVIVTPPPAPVLGAPATVTLEPQVVVTPPPATPPVVEPTPQ